jgi:thioester reductase-like protein
VKLLLKASECGLQTTVFRIGQISGGYANGAWATTSWMAILVKSSIALGGLPDASAVSQMINGLTITLLMSILLQRVSWVPFDAVSQLIVDVSTGTERTGFALHATHPRPALWHSIMTQVADALVHHGLTASPLPLISASEWYARLRALTEGADESMLEQVPAIKLSDFFGVMVDMDDDPSVEIGGLSDLGTERALAASDYLRDLPPLNEDDVQRWVNYWVQEGFLS